MATFKDTEGRTWVVAFDVAAVKRVRDATGFDVYRAADGGLKPLDDLLSDVVRFVDVLYVVCRPQAVERKLSDEDFGRALAGDAIEAAAEAIVEAVVDFFPTARRTHLRRALAIGRTIREELAAAGERELAKIEADPMSLLRPKEPPTGSPDSAGLTPAP